MQIIIITFNDYTLACAFAERVPWFCSTLFPLQIGFGGLFGVAVGVFLFVLRLFFLSCAPHSVLITKQIFKEQIELEFLVLCGMQISI